MFLTLPTALTWLRIIAIPLIVGVFYLPLSEGTRNLTAGLLFIAFAITDWLDGFLARRLNQTSAFGAFLDPVADKFLVCASLLILVHLQRADVFVALIIIGREIAISALREWMAKIGASRSVAVHMLGKVKTVMQMVAIPCLLYDGRLLNDGRLLGVIDTRSWGRFAELIHPVLQLLGLIDTRFWGWLLIWIAALLTVWSMLHYLRKALPEIRARVR